MFSDVARPCPYEGIPGRASGKRHPIGQAHDDLVTWGAGCGQSVAVGLELLVWAPVPALDDGCGATDR